MCISDALLCLKRSKKGLAWRRRDALGMGVISLCRISCIIWFSVEAEPMNGGRPAAHSYSTQPSAQRSLAVLCVLPSLNSSGAM